MNVKLNSSERQKRLQPYRNFYETLNQKAPYSRYHLEQTHAIKRPLRIFVNNYEPNNLVSNVRFTPFLRSNAIPGPFQPLQANKPIANNIQSVPNNPSDNAIFTTLPEFKLVQSNSFKKPNEPYIISHIKPSTTTIETFTATNIDIPAEIVEANREQEYTNTNYKLGQIGPTFPTTKATVGFVHKKQKTAVISPPQMKPAYIIIREKDNLPMNIYLSRKPFVTKTKYIEHSHSIIPQNTLKYVSAIPNGNDIKNFEIDTSSQISSTSNENVQIDKAIEDYEDDANTVQNPRSNQISTPTTSNNLAQTLKYLQDTNSLPKYITLNDIDHSIETLVKILTKLKKQRKFSKPIVVPEYSDEYVDHESSSEIQDESTPEGGTPGVPGVDYPALYNIPQTGFSCKTQRYKGFFGDPDTNCQVSFLMK